jgi:hypothetical protein
MLCAWRPVCGLVLTFVVLGHGIPAGARLRPEPDPELEAPSFGELFDDDGLDDDDDEAELSEGTLSLDLLGLGARGAPWARCWRGGRDVLRIGHGASPDGRPIACRQALLWRAWRRRYAVLRRPGVRIRLAREMPRLQMPLVAGSAPGGMGAPQRGRFARRGRPSTPGPGGAHMGFVFTALYVLRAPAPPPRPVTLPPAPKTSITATKSGER